jgi:ABC-type glycerol-3-phosphate transport system substrate-binding protein
MSNQKSRLSRRDFLKMSGTVMAGAALAACAAPAAPVAAPQAAAPAVNTGAKQTVRYLSWWFEEGQRGATWNAFIQEFNDSQSDIEVVAENIPFDAYTTKTIVGTQSGELDGDIIMATPELAPRLIRADLLAPLDDVLIRNNITDLSSAHDAMRKDGHLYGLDMVTVAFGILYNKTRYEEAGITPATTPDEWVDVTTALTDRENQKYGLWADHLISDPSNFWFQLEEWCMPYDGIWAEGTTPPAHLRADPQWVESLQAHV